MLVCIARARREMVHLTVTASPTAAWVWRQPIEATPWGRAPRHVVRHRDAVDGRDVVPRANGLGITTVLTPVRAPRANAVAERRVGTLRRECLNHLVIVNEAHLRAVLAEFAGTTTASDRTVRWICRPRRQPIGRGPAPSTRRQCLAACTTPTSVQPDPADVSGPDSVPRAPAHRAEAAQASGMTTWAVRLAGGIDGYCALCTAGT